MRIQHNIMAMNAYRNFSNNTSALSKNLEKLSSGYKINRAGDDAAGLAISEKMRAQITGLETAQKNAKDGISLIQTAEGALTEVHDMLNRMVELADQSANGTYDNETDRANLQKEFDALRSEIDRISQSTNFNGINLLDGAQMAEKIETALGGVLASGNADGTMPSEAVKAQISVMLDNLNNTKATTPAKVTDGTAPTAAKNTSVTMQLGGLDKVEVSTTASKTLAKKASFEIDLTGMSAQAQGDELEITINGNTSKLKGAALGATPSISDVAASFDGLVWTDDTGNKFDVTHKGGSGNTLVFTAQEEFDTGFTNSTTATITGSSVSGGPSNIKSGSASNGNYDQYDLSTLSDGAKITINGTEYTKAGSSGYSLDKNTFGDVTGLKTMLEKRGITANVTDPTKVTFSPTEKEVTFNSKKIFINKTTVEELGKMAADTGVLMSDLFDLQVNGKAVDWASTDKLKGGDKIELVSKTPGALHSTVMTNLNGISGTGVSSLSVVAGQEEGAGGAASTAEYELTFDFDKIEDGMTFKIGASTYELSTDGVASGTNVLIDLKNLDFTNGDDRKTAADKIQAALYAATDLANGGSSPEFNISAVPSTVGSKFTLTLTASDADDADTHNLGPVQVSEATVASGGITSTYTPGRDAAKASANAKFATAEYELDLTKVKVGDKITIGDTTLEIVATADKDLANGKIDLTTLDNGTKLGEFLQGAGYNGAHVAYADGKITITGTEAGGSGADLVAGAGKLVYAPKVETSAKAGDTDLNIQTGTTTYEDILNAQIGDKDTKVSDLFEVTVNGQAIDISNQTKTFQAGDKIEFTAKIAGQQTDDIMNAFQFSDGATVDKANGVAEGQGGAATKTQYELSFNFSKLADGQTFGIGDKNFEISTDGTANTEGNVVIDISTMDPTSEDGQLKIAQAIQKAVDTEMGREFASVAPDAVSDGKYTLSMTARSDGEATNHGAVRVSEAHAEAITGKYTAANESSKSQMGSFAQVSYEFDASKLAVGDKITIGNTSIEITDGESGAGKLSLEDAKNTDKIVNAFEANGYQSGKIEIADGKLTVTGTKVGQTAKDLVAGNGKVSLSSETRDLDAKVGGLTLQIGDTSDSFNQLTVSINSMDCESLGIDASKINIDSQEAASAAVKTIKDAINSVSSTRGDLGAMQNRLDHTINNLSVMQENIQDAESTIRDVDVAKEMMDYTKNNILIQSAQAMLAQANQVPQGVLQLLQ